MLINIERSERPMSKVESVDWLRTFLQGLGRTIHQKRGSFISPGCGLSRIDWSAVQTGSGTSLEIVAEWDAYKMVPFAPDSFQVTWPAQQGQKSQVSYTVSDPPQGGQRSTAFAPENATAGSMSNSLCS